jgi:hypothetical protein
MWGHLNRREAPGAIRVELERASLLIAFEPHIGTRARNIALPGVRRLHLGRIRDDLYDLCYRIVDTAHRLEVLRSSMRAVTVSLQSDEAAKS